MTTTLFDAADYLDTDDAVVGFLDAASEGWDVGHIARALAVVVRCKGMDEVTTRTGVSRQALASMLNEAPLTMMRIYEILDTLGLAMRLHLKAA